MRMNTDNARAVRYIVTGIPAHPGLLQRLAMWAACKLGRHRWLEDVGTYDPKTKKLKKPIVATRTCVICGRVEEIRP